MQSTEWCHLTAVNGVTLSDPSFKVTYFSEAMTKLL